MADVNRLKRLLQDQVLRFKLEMWFWVAFLVPDFIWFRNSVLVVSFLSIWALILTAGGAAKAAEAAQVAIETNDAIDAAID